jgi:hypothetical protein
MTVLVLAVGAATSAAGCLDRPAIPGEPQTKTNFTTQVAQQAVDKLDILFSIDNSASMGDKQAYLTQAIPDLINRLITPNCVNANTQAVDGPSVLDNTGTASCSKYLSGDPASQPEFPAVHDMHIGIVSSSLGPRLGDQSPSDGSGGECLPTATITLNGTTLNNHNDDQAHLLTRSSDPTLAVTAPPTEVPLADGATCGGNTNCPTPGPVGSGFLAWFPNNAANTGKDAGAGVFTETSGTQLITDFSDLIAGVHEYGCGIESQLESWYRFLIQPDPYASLKLNANKAQWVGVDTTIIQERHDFLRPDSLVAVIVLTDENDSEIDVRSIGGQGYLFMSTKFYPPHGTSQCANNPADPGCTSCQLLSNPSSDPACGTSAAPTNYNSPTDWGYDLNLRHVHMQAKYGLNPQFPVTRYVNGLQSQTIPDRLGEYPVDSSGNQSANYVGNQDCTNPLFAASLPTAAQLSANVTTNETTADANTLCNTITVNGQQKPNLGTARSKNLIFYAIIGGVPWQLLHFDPNSDANSQLSQQDWVRILGTDPDHYNYAGIDPHMVENYQPRQGSSAPSFQTASLLPAYPLPGLCASGGTTCGTSAAETAPQPPGSVTSPGTLADPYNGSEWITNVGPHKDLNVDREYACIFKLQTARDCSQNASGQYNVPANGDACDCSSTGLSATQLSPLCDPTNATSQLYAKAYPTIRELNLANKLGSNGIVSSICPIDVADNAAGDDPLYGYRPAVSSIINRLKSALTNQCLPQTLTQTDAGTPCLILATLPQGSQADCGTTKTPGMVQPDPQILQQFQSAAHQTWVQGGGASSGVPDPSTLPTCQVDQLTGGALDANGSCKTSQSPGWCYVTGAAAGTCAQAILFSPGTLPSGTTVNLQCIETSSALAAGQSGDGG